MVESDRPINPDALMLAKKIEAKAALALDSLAWEMRTMKLPNKYRSIMWEAVARAALKRSVNQS